MGKFITSIMGKFITSYTEITHNHKKRKFEFYFVKHIHKWCFHILPSIHLYIESHSPYDHDRFWKYGISGVYMSFQWGKWLYILGLCKKM